jgi:hypothetical protein
MDTMECTNLGRYHCMDISFTLDVEWAKIERSESDLSGIPGSSANDLMKNGYYGWTLWNVPISVDIIVWTARSHWT